MTAEVDRIARFRAVCLSCGWWGDELESEDAALSDADEHNTEKHADCGHGG